jgi:succinoglycan biosynthesis protein ExoA
MNQRIREAGGKVYLDTDIAVYYQPRESFTDLWKLYFRYGGARAGNLLKHKKLTSWRQFVPLAFLATLLGLAVLSIVSSWFLVALIALLGSYTATDLAVSGYVALTNKKVKLLGRLLIAFPCMHFAWALGFFLRFSQRTNPGYYWPY